jgi:hypothetical protein
VPSPGGWENDINTKFKKPLSYHLGTWLVFFRFLFLAGSWTPLQVFYVVARSLELLFIYAEEVHTLVTYGLFHGECIKGARWILFLCVAAQCHARLFSSHIWESGNLGLGRTNLVHLNVYELQGTEATRNQPVNHNRPTLVSSKYLISTTLRPTYSIDHYAWICVQFFWRNSTYCSNVADLASMGL